jgi:hypothetical protein
MARRGPAATVDSPARREDRRFASAGPALSTSASWFLTAVGVWTWAIWPNFLRNIAEDHRSWNDGPTRFFLVHLVLTVVSLLLGTGVGVIGVQQLRRRSRSAR